MLAQVVPGSNCCSHTDCSKLLVRIIQPVVQLGLLLGRDLREGHAHAKPVTVVSNFAENLEHLVVMGKAKTNLAGWDAACRM
jgi:hypothetical protein